MIDPKTAIAAAEITGKIAPRATAEIDKFGADIVKTARLILAPLQLTALLQDRLARHIERAIERVPKDQLIAPTQSIALSIADKLRFQEDNEPITELYINLLARAMDGHRVGEAHPAFSMIIAQLAPDEVLFLNETTRRPETIILAPIGGVIYPPPEQRQERLEELAMPLPLREIAESMMFSYENLNQPELFPVYLEHLLNLGLVAFSNELKAFKGYPHIFGTYEAEKMRVYSIRMTQFGSLFLKACTNSKV